MSETTAATAGPTTAASAGPTTAALLAEIADVGRDPVRGGYSRPVFSAGERTLVDWFTEAAGRRGLDPTVDRNGIVWGWWNPTGAPLRDAVVTGSHLDSVPGGGAFDGPLGLASALRAVDLLQARGLRPERPLAVAVFPEEEGSRYGVACLGSRLLAGVLEPEKALALKDADGVTYAQSLTAAGLDPSAIGRDDETLARIGAFVELHVEQGRGLIDLDAPVAVGAAILGHGRWRVSITGQGNHAGTTLMADRRDPLLVAAEVVVAVRRIGARHAGARATVGRIQPIPGGTNVIASQVDLWLDVRHVDDLVTAAVVAEITAEASRCAAAEGCQVQVRQESLSPTVDLDPQLGARMARTLGGAPVLDTGAGHDAGVLAARLPSAMLFVRNPTGISHSPEEAVEDADADRGAVALADVLADLLGGTFTP